jgi:redox-sensitive bicupin YhaK (pirin superfamily)
MTNSRRIVRRVVGERHGPITRLISPSELGEDLKPFIFLDFFHASIEPGFGFGMHPHSGIATLTWQPGSDVQYEDTTGKNGILKAGGLEWMNAGGGAWHQGLLLGTGLVTGFQLWVPLPPGVEDGPSSGQYVPPEQVPVSVLTGGRVAVLLGEYPSTAGIVSSPIVSHQTMNYLVVELEGGAGWVYQPPRSHNVAWAFVFEGQPTVLDHPSHRELLVFDGEGAIDFESTDAPSQILVGSGRRHDYPLVLGPGSVHTNAHSLARGQHRIQELGVDLRSAGRPSMSIAVQ